MTTFLLLISFILNIIAIFAVIILYLRQNRFFQVEERQAKMIKELEELISTYMMEMKEENETFINKLAKQKENKNLNKKTSYNHSQVELMSENKVEYNPVSLIKETKREIAEPSKKEPNQLKKEHSPQIEKTVAFQAVKAYQQSTRPKVEKDLIGENWTVNETLKEENVMVEMDSISNETPGEQEQMEKDVGEKLYMKSLYNQTLLLKKQGFSVEEIARKLNKGKTEIELLLKLYQIK